MIFKEAIILRLLHNNGDFFASCFVVIGIVNLWNTKGEAFIVAEAKAHRKQQLVFNFTLCTSEKKERNSIKVTLTNNNKK